MDTEVNPIDLPKLKELIHEGVTAIPIDKDNNQAILVIGDTGVGKSTILSFLNGSQLVVRFDGLKPTLDSINQTRIKIGHDKYSETSVPTKVVIDRMAFYDCPGFNDNKGEEYQISNSFFLQRLLDIYQRVKIVLIVDESHISEARADKLPKLVRNLHKSFKTFDDIQDGCMMIINKAGKENTQEDYHIQLQKLIALQNQNGFLFEEEERKFLEFLIHKNRILIFRQAGKESRNKMFVGGTSENRILSTVKNLQFVKSKHIQNILSESAKLAIRDFIDEITNRSNHKIEIVCQQIIDLYSEKIHNLGKDIDEILSIKEHIISLAEEIKSAAKESIMSILQRQLKHNKVQDFEDDFASVMFFKAIYDKTTIYFSNLVNKIYSQLSHLLTKLDKHITIIQREDEEEKAREKERLQERMREQERQKEKIVAMEYCQKMDGLKTVGQSMCSSRKYMIDEIRNALKCLTSVEEELKRVKEEAVNLQHLNKSIESQFNRIDQKYMQKKYAR